MFKRFLKAERFLLNEATPDAPPAGAPASSDTPPPSPSDAPPTQPPSVDWKSLVSKDYAEKPMFQNYKDINDVFKSLEHAQALVGREKAVIPTKNSHADEYKAYFQKVGLPETREAYEAKIEGFEEAEKKALLDIAYENNMLPSQVEKMVEYFKTQNESKAAFENEAYERELATVESDLKSEYGEAYNMKLRQAHEVAKHFGGDEFISYLDESGLGSDKMFIKTMIKVAESLKSEDSFNDDVHSKFNMTKADANMAINKIMGEPAYFDNNHAQHKDYVAKMLSLQEIVAQD